MTGPEIIEMILERASNKESVSLSSVACEMLAYEIRELQRLQSSPAPVGVVRWIEASKELPREEEEVWVCVRNKNKEDGIPLYDMTSLDEDRKWRKRLHTWEDIVWWAYPVSPESSPAPDGQPILAEAFADNGTHSHWYLIDPKTGAKVWSEDPEECAARGFSVSFPAQVGGEGAEEMTPAEEGECWKATGVIFHGDPDVHCLGMRMARKAFKIGRSRLPALKTGEAETCTWTTDPDSGEDDREYETQCGKNFMLLHGDPAENGMRFCYACGKTIAIPSPVACSDCTHCYADHDFEGGAWDECGKDHWIGERREERKPAPCADFEPRAQATTSGEVGG